MDHGEVQDTKYVPVFNKAALRQDKNTCACTIFTRNLYLEQVVYPYVLKYRRHRKHYTSSTR